MRMIIRLYSCSSKCVIITPLPFQIDRCVMSEKMMRFNHQDVKILNKINRYDGFFKLQEYELSHKLFQGGWSLPFTREVFERGDSAAALAYDAKQDCVVLTEQFRPGCLNSDTSPWSVELIAGMQSKDETPESVVRREAEEEVGVALGKLEFITRYWVSPGGSTERISLFCAQIDSTQAGGTHGLVHDHEDILSVILPVSEVFALLEGGKIENAASIIALQWFKVHHIRLKKLWA